MPLGFHSHQRAGKPRMLTKRNMPLPFSPTHQCVPTPKEDRKIDAWSRIYLEQPGNQVVIPKIQRTIWGSGNQYS